MKHQRRQKETVHGTDCACWECVQALERAIVREGFGQRLSIGQQIDLLISLISEHDAVALMPVLGTLQWIRDNETKIRHRLAE